MNRAANSRVGTAPADISGHRGIDVGVVRAGIALEKRDRGPCSLPVATRSSSSRIAERLHINHSKSAGALYGVRGARRTDRNPCRCSVDPFSMQLVAISVSMVFSARAVVVEARPTRQISADWRFNSYAVAPGDDQTGISWVFERSVS